MPDTPRESYSGIKHTACERCAFGSGEHAEWCDEWAPPNAALMRAAQEYRLLKSGRRGVCFWCLNPFSRCECSVIKAEK